MARERMECRSSRRRGGPGSCLPLCTRHLSTHRAYTFDEGRVGPVVCAWSAYLPRGRLYGCFLACGQGKVTRMHLGDEEWDVQATRQVELLSRSWPGLKH